MKYKVGDKVRIKNKEWYEDNCNRYGVLECGDYEFFEPMNEYCGKVVTIIRVDDCYRVNIDKGAFCWTDEMIEGLVEHIDCKKCGLTFTSTRCLFMDNCPHNKPKNIMEEETLIERVDDNRLPFNEWLSHKGAFHIPEGYELKDENGNVINATKIVLEKKKKEYPKTYEECCNVLSLSDDGRLYTKGYKASLIQNFQKLLIARNAYWKIAGEEMGLGKPWEPDWNHNTEKYVIYPYQYLYSIDVENYRNTILAFPTSEMRDAFYENFKELIEQCKELL